MRNLTKSQRLQIAAAARTLSTAAQLAFLADVRSMIEARCGSHIVISNGDVQRAIEEVLDAAPWPKSRVFLCDSKQETTTMSNFDPAMAARVRAERARAELEDNAIENGILQDGCSLVVPLFMADGNINPKLTFVQRLMAEKVQKAQKAAMDAAASTSTTGGPTMTTRNYTMADAQRFGLQDASALSRPGFRYNGADPYAKDQAIIAYADRDLEYAEAWKTKPPLPYSTELTGEGSRGPYDKTGMGRECDSCMTNTGERGRKIDIGGKLVCVPLEIARSTCARPLKLTRRRRRLNCLPATLPGLIMKMPSATLGVIRLAVFRFRIASSRPRRRSGLILRRMCSALISRRTLQLSRRSTASVCKRFTIG